MKYAITNFTGKNVLTIELTGMHDDLIAVLRAAQQTLDERETARQKRLIDALGGAMSSTSRA